ncbi:MAG: EcsC family protein [Luteolibacter sp.]
MDHLPSEPDSSPGNRIAEAILHFLGKVPETERAVSRTPAQCARTIANAAAVKAATAAGALALPPGPLGWLTILPELATVWKIQGQMVADIAGAYGKQAALSREQMIYCLFRHAAAQAVRDLVVRVGERYLVRRVSVRVLESIAKKVGVKVTQHAVGKGIARWMPIVGALGVGAYAYYDTAQVAKTAIELFEGEVELEEEKPKGPPPLPLA